VCEWTRTLRDLRETAAEDCDIVDDGSDSSDDVEEVIIEESNDKWDCETILCEFCKQLLRDLIHLKPSAVRLVCHADVKSVHLLIFHLHVA